MRALVVYESMYGNTRTIATAIGAGLAARFAVAVVAVNEVLAEQVAGADLLVIGGPTHVRGMSRPSTRKGAVEAAHKPGSGVELEPGSDGPGLREWLASLGPVRGKAAVFDTRIHMAELVTGAASRSIARQLRRHGIELVVKPESFLVTKANQLEAGEEVRARGWGEHIAEMAA
jgi:hypothetical protein